MTTSPVVKRQKRRVSSDENTYFATTFAGLEEVLAKELTTQGASSTKVARRGVEFTGDVTVMYKANLWSRTAHRVLVPIAKFPAKDREELYAGVRSIRWDEHMDAAGTMAVDTVGTNAQLKHTQFTSRVVKDGVVDWFKDNAGRRPDVDLRNPQLRLNAHLEGDVCSLSWDSSGSKLNQRGYRPTFGATAPLKENLAAGMLLLSGYRGEGPLMDPMCGSGTIIVEAAMIAKNLAPGLLGRTFAFINHPSYHIRLWSNLQADAREAIKEIDDCPISGSDISEEAVRSSTAAVLGAGVDDLVKIRRAPLTDLVGIDAGMIVTNPPYGERLGELNQLSSLYTNLGDLMKNRCRGASAHVIVGSKFLAGKIGLRTTRRDILFNGAIECRLMHFDLY